MPTIDSDAHVIENERTWGYMAGPDAQYRPAVLRQQTADGPAKLSVCPMALQPAPPP